MPPAMLPVPMIVMSMDSVYPDLRDATTRESDVAGPACARPRRRPAVDPRNVRIGAFDSRTSHGSQAEETEGGLRAVRRCEPRRDPGRMLRALYERDITAGPDRRHIRGRAQRGFIASRPQTVETADELARIWRDARRGQVFPLNPLTGLLGFLGARDHLVPESGLRRLIERHIEFDGSRTADPAARRRRRRGHRRGAAALARPRTRRGAGSAAIPGVLAPVAWEDRTLMDGGVANNTPISHAVELGAERIYVLPTGHACALEEPPSGALAMALHAISLLTHRRLIDDIERHRGDAQLVVLPPPCPLHTQPIDFDHADELIDRRADRRPRVPRRRRGGATADPHAHASARRLRRRSPKTGQDRCLTEVRLQSRGAQTVRGIELPHRGSRRRRLRHQRGRTRRAHAVAHGPRATLGVAFVVAAVLLLGAGAALVHSPGSARATRAAALLFAGLIASYAAATTVGIPLLSVEPEAVEAWRSRRSSSSRSGSSSP